MNLLVLNPNTSVAMTENLLRQIGSIPAVHARGSTASWGVEVIATHASFAIAAHAAIDTWATLAAADVSGIDAILLGCFGDPGLAALQELAPVPVYGLASSAIEQTAKEPGKFAVVTGGPGWRPILDQLVGSRGLADRYTGTFTARLNGLSMLADPVATATLIDEQIACAVRAGAERIILGGAVFAGQCHRFTSEVPLVDCLEASLEWIATQPVTSRAHDALPAIRSCGLSDSLAGLLQQQQTR